MWTKTSCPATLVLAPLLQIDIKGKITRFGKNPEDVGHDALCAQLGANLADFYQALSISK